VVGLSPAQRLHFEIYGYVLLDHLLGLDEVERLRDVIFRMRDDPEKQKKGVFTITKGRSYYIRMGNLVEYDPAIVEFAAHPKIVPLAEDLVGGSVRLEENEAIINRRDPALACNGRGNTYKLHRAIDPSWGCYTECGKRHFLFVKALAFLTDVGPGDGGTTVVPGSHLTLWPRHDIFAAVQEDRSLCKCIEAKAGSVLLFTEAILHGTTDILGDRERVIITSGYSAPMLRMENGHRIRPEFVEELPDEIQPLISGSQRWDWQRHYK